MMQHLAQGTLPSKKDEVVQKLSEFITSNQDPLKEFVDQVTVRICAIYLSTL
jgi:hypothetical protein